MSARVFVFRFELSEEQVAKLAQVAESQGTTARDEVYWAATNGISAMLEAPL